MRIINLILLILLANLLYGQSAYKMKGNDKAIDASFLTSYYHQDGNNSAVEGGIGGEELVDFANILVVNVPLDSVRSISVSVGLDAYSSASTDRIDANVSSASIEDKRVYGNIGYTQKYLSQGFTWGVKGGFSQEYDYTSFSGGLHLAKEWNQGNSELGFSAQAFIDKWTLYFPAELRRTASVSTDKRNSFNASAVYSQVVNKRMQFSLSAEAIYMEGLLSTPFHRVYFSEAATADIERLPNTRLKVPVSLRFNYFMTEKMVLRTYYRYYFDDFGVRAHTANIEVPIKLNDAFSISPFVRYHIQQGSKYFGGFKENLSTEEFYTSDYDLSTLSSQKAGIAIGYYPAFGISGSKVLGREMIFKSIELRLAYYKRDTGLTAYLASLNFSFRL